MALVGRTVVVAFDTLRGRRLHSFLASAWTDDDG